jgi:ABC-type phosphate transport system substrate-binding protein
MSAFKQNMRKLGARAGLLAGASAAVLAISGIGAGGAMAAATCPHASNAIAGKGSSLQKSAQLEVWNPKYNAACSTKGGQTASYESTGSGPGLEAFRFTGTGAINHGFQFIGSDDAPNRGQIEHAELVSGGARPVIVPVSQTAIAVAVNLPTGCKFKKGKGITWAELNQAFGGKTITRWRQFSNIEPNTVGGACDVAVKRVVRAEGSGTTFQFKNYLQTLHEQKSAEALPCSVSLPGGGTATEWSQLEEVGTSEQPNKTWPVCKNEKGEVITTEIITAAGGGAVAEKVIANTGAIGYLALPDAEASTHKTTVALMQNSLVGTTATYVSPATEESNAACSNARYTLPTEAYEGTGAGIASDLSKVFGAQPNIGGSEYPLCTLTFDIGWTDYGKAGYETEAKAKGTTALAWGQDVRDYIANYMLLTGQTDLVGKWYSALPVGKGVGTNSDVQKAAEIAAGNLPS